jgi:hypothetical protein
VAFVHENSRDRENKNNRISCLRLIRGSLISLRMTPDLGIENCHFWWSQGEISPNKKSGRKLSRFFLLPDLSPFFPEWTQLLLLHRFGILSQPGGITGLVI